MNLNQRIFALTGLTLGKLLLLLGVSAGALGGVYFLIVTDQKSTIATEPAPNRTRDSSFKSRLIQLSILPTGYRKMDYSVQIEELDKKIATARAMVDEDHELSADARGKLFGLMALRISNLAENSLFDDDGYQDLLELKQEILRDGSKKYKSFALSQHLVTEFARFHTDPSEENLTAARQAVRDLKLIDSLSPSDGQSIFSSAKILASSSIDPKGTASLLVELGDVFNTFSEKRFVPVGSAMADLVHFKDYHPLLDSPFSPEIGLADELIEQCEKHPPQSLLTFQVMARVSEPYLQVQFIDKAKQYLTKFREFAGNPIIHESSQPNIARVLDALEVRINTIGNPFNFEGHTASGDAIDLRNGKPSFVVFWSPDDARSLAFVELVIRSEIFSRRLNSNLVLVATTELSEAEIEEFSKRFQVATFVDNKTAKRMLYDNGVSSVPYLVLVDEQGNVFKHGGATDPTKSNR